MDRLRPAQNRRLRQGRLQSCPGLPLRFDPYLSVRFNQCFRGDSRTFSPCKMTGNPGDLALQTSPHRLAGHPPRVGVDEKDRWAGPPLPARPVIGEFSGNVTLEYGNYDNKRGSGALNIPLSENAALRDELAALRGMVEALQSAGSR